MKKIFMILFLSASANLLIAQNTSVAINSTGAEADTSAILDISSLNSGLLIPRISILNDTDKITIKNPATGLMVYNTNTSMTNGAGAGYYSWNDSIWNPILLVSKAACGGSQVLQSNGGGTLPGWTPSPYFTHYVGEQYGGGVVFDVYKDACGVEHGLIVGTTDLASSAYSNITAMIGAGARYWDNGSLNTTAIINQAGHVTSAALLCRNYNGGGYNDWYLPAVQETEKMYSARFIINKVLGANGLKESNYWSSTEYGIFCCQAYIYVRGSGMMSTGKTQTWPMVRAIRAF